MTSTISIKSTVLKVLITFCLLTLLIPAVSATGSGTIGDPYIITTPAELQAMNTDLSAYYALGNDIDMSGYAYTAVGSSATPFFGGLDGNNYTISSLYISQTATDYQGLFGVIGPGTLCTDIQLYNFTISGSSYVGGLVGLVVMSDASNATCYITNVDISHSMIIGAATGSYVGGICGRSYNYANIALINCDADYCTISTGHQVCGGIMGYGAYTNSQATATNCSVENCVITSGGNICGGIMGYGAYTNSQATANNCLVKNCVITAAGYACGGIMGAGADTGSQATANNCLVENCVITAGAKYCGGIMGDGAFSLSQATVINCTTAYTTIKSASGYSAGIIGRISAGCTWYVADNIVTSTTIIATTGIAAGAVAECS